MKAYIIKKTYKESVKMMGVNPELTLVAIDSSIILNDEALKKIPMYWVSDNTVLPSGLYTMAWCSGRENRIFHVEDSECLQMEAGTPIDFFDQVQPLVEVELDRKVKFNRGDAKWFPTGAQFPLACAGKIAMKTWQTSGTSWVPILRKKYIKVVGHIAYDDWGREWSQEKYFLTLSQANAWKRKNPNLKFSTYIVKC